MNFIYTNCTDSHFLYLGQPRIQDWKLHWLVVRHFSMGLSYFCVFYKRGAEYFFSKLSVQQPQKLRCVTSEQICFLPWEIQYLLLGQIAQYNELRFPFGNKIVHTTCYKTSEFPKLRTSLLKCGPLYTQESPGPLLMLYRKWGSGNQHKKMLIF